MTSSGADHPSFSTRLRSSTLSCAAFQSSCLAKLTWLPNWSLTMVPLSLVMLNARKPTGQMETKLTFVLFPYSFEVDILSNLLKAQCDMADWKFLSSLLHLHESHVKLSSWCQFLPPVEVRNQHLNTPLNKNTKSCMLAMRTKQAEN